MQEFLPGENMNRNIVFYACIKEHIGVLKALKDYNFQLFYKIDIENHSVLSFSLQEEKY